MDVEDLKGGREDSGDLGENYCLFSRYLYVFVKLKSLLCQIWPKICRAWSCWTHLIKTKAYCKGFTISFIEGVNIYLIHIVHAYA